MVQSTEVGCRTCPWTRAVALDLLIAKSNHFPQLPFPSARCRTFKLKSPLSPPIFIFLNTVHIWNLALPHFNQHRNQEGLPLSITLHSKIPPLHFANPSTFGFSSAFFVSPTAEFSSIPLYNTEYADRTTPRVWWQFVVIVLPICVRRTAATTPFCDLVNADLPQ